MPTLLAAVNSFTSRSQLNTRRDIDGIDHWNSILVNSQSAQTEDKTIDYSSAPRRELLVNIHQQHGESAIIRYTTLHWHLIIWDEWDSPKVCSETGLRSRVQTQTRQRSKTQRAKSHLQVQHQPPKFMQIIINATSTEKWENNGENGLTIACLLYWFAFIFKD